MSLWNALIDYLEMTGKKKEIVERKRERIKRVAYAYECFSVKKIERA